MSNEELNAKFVFLDKGYERRWSFIENDKELADYMQDGSLEEGEYIVEIKKLFKIKQIVERRNELEEVKKV